MNPALVPNPVSNGLPAVVLPCKRSEAGEVVAKPPEGAAETHGPLADAWRAVRAVHDDLMDDFDSPRGLAEHAFTRRDRVTQLHAALRGLLALVQRLVLLMALSFNLAPAPLRSRRPPLIARRLCRVGVRVTFAKWPETWQVAVPSLLAPARRPGRARRYIPVAERRPPPPVLPLWGAACRLEALRRLIADPQPAARRLAARLARSAPQARVPLRPAGLDRWRTPRDPDAIPYLLTRFIPDMQELCESALAERARREPG